MSMAKYFSRLLSRTLSTRVFLALLGLVIVADVLVLGWAFATFPGDEAALLEMQEVRVGWLDRVALALSVIGAGGIGGSVAVPSIPLAVVASALILKRWSEAVFLAAATLAPVVNLGLKELAGRARPDAELAVVMESGYGFPSGHAVFAASFFGALLLVLCRSNYLKTRRRMQWVVRTSLILLILAVGFSRVYLGVHWPSDVVAGFLVGAIYLALVDSVSNHIPLPSPQSKD